MRVFLAIDVPYSEHLDKIYDILSKDGYCKLVNKDILHLTIHFYGELSERQVNIFKEILKTIDFPKFEYELNGIGFFPNHDEIQVIWVGFESIMIEAFYREVKKKFQFQPKQKFVPHITIARASQRLDDEVYEKLLELQSEWFGSGIVNSLKLKKSTLTPNGPIYEDLAEVELK
ncbi:MAG: RNA 2',3'-cyclic phosphodiesterase [Candidatus Anstonellales archaeon]